MSYLYVNEQGARIGVDGGYITVQMKNDLLRKIPSETLENISLFGNVSITTQAMQRCLKLGITLNFFSSNGRTVMKPFFFKGFYNLRMQGEVGKLLFC